MSHVCNYSLSNGIFNSFPLLIIHIHSYLKPQTDTAFKIYCKVYRAKMQRQFIKVSHLKTLFSKTKFKEEENYHFL